MNCTPLWRAFCAIVMLVVLVPALNSGAGVVAPPPVYAQQDPRFFAETGFRISDDRFWEYYQRRGGLRSFGYPVSRKFLLLGTEVQLFQRRMMQIRPDGGVGLVNMLDTDILPYTTINGAILPPKIESLVAQAPQVGSPGYNVAILQFVHEHSPDVFEGLPVNFYQTFINAITMEQAFPEGGGDPSLLLGLDLEIWGVPVSEPAYDPNNRNFVYQRYQRGIMHYDRLLNVTEGLLLADVFKAILTGQNLPPDVALAAANSRYYRQYDNSRPNGLARPAQLPGTNLKDAFERESPVPGGAPTPFNPPPPAPLPTINQAYGMQAQMIGEDQERIFGFVSGAGFNWVKQQVRWGELERTRGNIKFNDLDPIVDKANARGTKVMFNVTTSPPWARADGNTFAAPDNPNDLANFMAALATRYRGRVHAYSIWNEPNTTREWAAPVDACAYVDLLAVVAPRVKSADPNAIVISSGLTPTGINDPNLAIDDAIYLDQMYRCRGGIFRQLGDAVGLHGVGYNNAPTDWVDQHSVDTPGFKSHPSFYFRRIWQLHDIMNSFGDSRQVWVLEFHWGSADPPVPAGYEWATQLSAGTVADFYATAIQMMNAEPWIGGFFVWNLNYRTFANYHVNEGAIFGILNEDWSPRAMYTRLRNLPK